LNFKEVDIYDTEQVKESIAPFVLISCRNRLKRRPKNGRECRWILAFPFWSLDKRRRKDKVRRRG
jgi:hypothetical protein